MLISLHINFHLRFFQLTDLQTNSRLGVKFYDEQLTREIITFEVTPPLVAGRQYKIVMYYEAILNDALRGFYRSSYVENGVTKYLAVSQMEAPDARR